MLSSKFFSNNRNKVFNLIEDNSIVILHSNYILFKTCDEVYPFQVNKNFYYLTGLKQDNIIVLVGKVNGEYVEKLFIDENDPQEVKWVGAKYYKNEASKITGIKEENIYYMDNFDKVVFDYVQPNRYSMGQVKNIYLDLEKQQVPQYRTFATEYCENLRHEYPQVLIHDIYSMLIGLRAIKEDCEIEEMVKSIDTTNRAILNVMDHKHKLANEIYAESYYDFTVKSENKVTQFDSICAAGKNAVTLHYHSNNSVIEKDALLLMDVGVCTNEYGSDITRTFPVSGKFTDRQKEVYEAVLNVNKKCIEYAKDGMTWKELNDYANNLLTDALSKLGKLTKGKTLRDYYWHSIGHSLGLDTHDPCVRSKGLQKGMVITIEPGLYIEEEGIGIRIEDDILITEGKAIVLSKDIIKEIKDIEKYMNK